MALHIPCQDPANQHPPPPGQEETQQPHFPACEIICHVDVKQLIHLLIVITVSSVWFILFFNLFFPLPLRCLAFPRGSSLVWPTQSWQQQLRGIQRLEERLVVCWGWGDPAAALPHPQLGGTGAPGHSSALELLIKAWYFCFWACEVLAWAEPSPRGVCF